MPICILVILVILTISVLCDSLEMSEKEHRYNKRNEAKEYHDQYNTLEKPEYTYTEPFINSDLEYAPSKGQSWHSYSIEAEIYAKTGFKTKERSHINPPKGAWYTHRMPQGCFMCADQNLISVLIDVIKLMSSKYPNQKF